MTGVLEDDDDNGYLITSHFLFAYIKESYLAEKNHDHHNRHHHHSCICLANLGDYSCLQSTYCYRMMALTKV